MAIRPKQKKDKPASHDRPLPKRRDPNGHPTAPDTDSDDPHSTHRREDPDNPRNPGDLPDQQLSNSSDTTSRARQLVDKALTMERGARSFVLALLLLTGSTYLGARPQPRQAARPADDAPAGRSSGFVDNQQKNVAPDIRAKKQIRRSIFEDKSLSPEAHNIKVSSRNGSILLAGPVESQEEKQLVEAKAAEIVGPANVVSRIRVVSNARTLTVEK
jgi:hyperosmotically inducible protein